ncbi:MAG TPA: YCF48-related protein [Ignavibacteria bacterium]|nr:YCF48-related protein [Ignavibacteria bacterium]
MINIRRNIILLSLILFSNISICFSQSGWISQQSGININLNSVKFVNTNTGWCAGENGIILLTTNGGNNWIVQISGYNGNLNDVSFLTAKIGYAAGDSGVILKTITGGTNWIRININPNNELYSVFFISETLGYAGGFRQNPINQFYRTSDGGNSWDSVQFESNIRDILFINSATGWIASESFSEANSQIYKTINSGLNWNKQFASSLYINSLFFIDSLNGWFGAPRAVLGVPNIYRTTNGGENWIPAPPWSGSEINSILFVSKLRGYAAGPNKLIQFTSDGGVIWTGQSYSTNGSSYNSVDFIDSLTGWVVGDSGIILKTTTGGVITGFSNTVSEIPEKYFLSQNYPNPFNPVTSLGFGISNLGFVSLKIYDASGKEIKTLVNEIKQPGLYKVEFDGSSLASGIYFYKLESGNFIQTKRMVLLK